MSSGRPGRGGRQGRAARRTARGLTVGLLAGCLCWRPTKTVKEWEARTAVRAPIRRAASGGSTSMMRGVTRMRGWKEWPAEYNKYFGDYSLDLPTMHNPYAPQPLPPPPRPPSTLTTAGDSCRTSALGSRLVGRGWGAGGSPFITTQWVGTTTCAAANEEGQEGGEGDERRVRGGRGGPGGKSLASSTSVSLVA